MRPISSDKFDNINSPNVWRVETTVEINALRQPINYWDYKYIRVSIPVRV